MRKIVTVLLVNLAFHGINSLPSSPDYDEQYSDYTLLSREEADRYGLMNLTINQCVENESNRSSNNYPFILDSTINLVNESFVRSASHDVQCPKEFMKIVIGQDYIILLKDGTLWIPLIDVKVPQDQYCFFSSISSDGVMTSALNVCLPIPPVERCCPSGKSFDAELQTCKQSVIAQPTTPEVLIHIDELGILVDIYNQLPHKTLSCDEDERIIKKIVSYDHYLSLYQDTLTFSSFNYDGENYFTVPANKFCLDGESIEDEIEVSLCYDDPREKIIKLCQNDHCLRKCCGKNQTGFFNDYDRPICDQPSSTDEWIVKNTSNSIWNYGLPLCKESHFIVKPDENIDHAFTLTDNGSLYFPKLDKTVEPYLYCIDHFYSNDMTLQEAAVLCTPEDEVDASTCQSIVISIYQILFVVSSVFLLIAMLIFMAVPELRGPVYNKCFAFHTASLFAGFIALIVKEWATHQISMTSCISIGLFIQFSFLCSFFWLNVLCFDLLKTLLRCNTVTSEEKRHRFIRYNIYGWGGPLVICATTATIQFLPRDATTTVILPGFGVNGCWLKDDVSAWAYFNGVVLLLNLSDVIMFFIYCFHALSTICWMSSNIKNSKIFKERIILTIQLVTLMGITWIFEVINGQSEVVCVDNYITLWFIPDVINALRGLIIFILLIIKVDVQEKVKEYLRPTVRSMKTFIVLHSLSNVMPQSHSGMTPHEPVKSVSSSDSAL